MVLDGSIANTLVLLVVMRVITTLVFEPPTTGLLFATVTNLSALGPGGVTSPNWIAGVTESGVSVPVPFSAVVGLLPALLVKLRAPVYVPAAVGVKVTPTVQLAPAASIVDPLRLHGLPPMLVVPNGAGTPIPLTVSPTELGFDIVAVPTVALVVPTCVLGNAMLPVTLIVPATPLPVRFTVEFCVPTMPGTVLGTLTWPVKVPSAVAVKFTPNVQVALGASMVPEQPSDTIVQFGPILGPERVLAVIVPMLIVTDD